MFIDVLNKVLDLQIVFSDGQWASALPAWVVQFSGGKAEDLLLGNTFLVLSPSSFLYGFFMWINRLVKYSVRCFYSVMVAAISVSLKSHYMLHNHLIRYPS